MRHSRTIAHFEAEARMADREAAKAPGGSATEAGWRQVANSWRQLVDHALTEHTGAELPLFSVH